MKHRDAIHMATELSARQGVQVRAEDVVDALNKAKVSFVLTGAIAIGGYTGEPRATKDVDIIVRPKDREKATKALAARFPNLAFEPGEALTSFYDPKTFAIWIDLVHTDRADFLANFKNRVKVESYFIPTRKMFFIQKFMGMNNPNRPAEKRAFDFGDFIRMARVMHDKGEGLNLQEMQLMCHEIPFGDRDLGREVFEAVRDAINGRLNLPHLPLR